MTSQNLQTDSNSEFYVTGGTMSPNAQSYVSRQADEELFDGLQTGKFCYVLTSRQMGKSSLMVRTVGRLRKEGFEVVVLDLTTIGQNLTPEQWYDGIQLQIGERLNLEDQLNEFWLANGRLGPLQRWMKAMREVVLEKCKKPIVVFIDEVEVVHALNFSTSEFFAGIRAFYNSRNEDPELKRLHFCLIGVTTPSDLTKDVKTTPLNVGGLRIELADFTAANTGRLANNLGRDSQTNEQLLKRILYWTGGHPYLTQRFCKEVAEDANIRNAEDIDDLCQREFLSPGARDTEDNLVFVRDRMLRSDEDLIGLLTLYSRIHKGKRIPNDNLNPFVKTLLLSGITRPTIDGKLAIRNRIYERVFDRQWIEGNMPDAELKKQRAQYRTRLMRLGTAALFVITVLGTSTAVAFWQKFKADNTALELGVTKESLAETERNLQKSERNLNERKRSFSIAIQEKELEISEKNRDLAAKEMQIEDKTKAAQEKAQEAYRLGRIADERLKSVHKLEYAAKVNLAKSLYDDGNMDSAMKVLGETDQQQRGVEWNFLNHLMEGVVPFVNTGREMIHGLMFSPDGKHLVAKGRTSPLLLWDPQTGQQQDLILGDDLRAFSDYAFSPDGKWFASYGSSSGLILWDTSTNPWTRRAVSTDTPNEVYRFVSFTPDSKEFVTLSQREQEFFLRHWDVQTRNQTRNQLEDYGTRFGMKNLKVIRFAFGGHLLTRYDEPIPKTERDRTVVALLSSLGRTILRYEVTGRQYVYAFSANGQVMAEFLEGDSLGISIRRNFVEEASAQPLENSTSSTNWKDIQLSRNGKLIAALNQQEVRIWDTETLKIVRVIPLVNDLYKSIAFSPDGLKLAIGGFDCFLSACDVYANAALTIWDVYSEADVFAFNREKFLAASLDGTKVVTQNADGNLSLWSTLKRESIRLPITSERWQSDTVSFSPNGNHFVAFLRELGVGDKQSLRLWNAVSGTEVRLKSQTECRFTMSTAFSPDGKRLISICKDGRAQVFGVETGNEINSFLTNTGAGSVSSIWEDPRTKMFVTDKQLIISTPRHPELTDSLDTEVTAWNLERGIRQEIGVCSENVIRVSSDGKWLVTRDLKDDYRLRHTTNQRCDLPPLINRDDDEIPNAIAFSEDGKFLGLFYGVLFYKDTQSFGEKAHYVVKDLTTMKDTPLEQAREEAFLDGIQFSPSARWILFGNNYWNTRTGNGNKIVGCTGNPVFSADEKRLVTSCGDGNIKLWDLENGQEMLKIRAHDSFVDRVFIMPDNKHMLTATEKDVKLWRLRF